MASLGVPSVVEAGSMCLFPSFSYQHPRVAFPFVAALKAVSLFGYKWKSHPWVLVVRPLGLTKGWLRWPARGN